MTGVVSFRFQISVSAARRPGVFCVAWACRRRGGQRAMYLRAVIWVLDGYTGTPIGFGLPNSWPLPDIEGCPTCCRKSQRWQLQHITIWHLRKLPPISSQPTRNGCKPSKNHCKHCRSRAARPFCIGLARRLVGHVSGGARQARRHHQRSQGQARHGQQAPALQAGQQRGRGLGRRRRGHCRENCRRRRV